PGRLARVPARCPARAQPPHARESPRPQATAPRARRWADRAPDKPKGPRASAVRAQGHRPAAHATRTPGAEALRRHLARPKRVLLDKESGVPARPAGRATRRSMPRADRA